MSSQVEVRADLGLERSDEERLVLDKANQEMHGLYHAAAMVRDRLVAARSREQIAAEFVEILYTTEAVAQDDIDGAIAQFVFF